MRAATRLVMMIAAAIVLWGCGREEEVVLTRSGYEDFLPRYNAYIKRWLEGQKKETVEKVRQTGEEIAGSGGEAKEALERQLAGLKRDVEKYEYRLARGDYFRFGDTSEIPADLEWRRGLDHEEIGDPRAKKGGTFNVDIRTFPPTLRPFGDNSNNSFRSSLYDDIDMPLVGLHPKSMEMIPGLAREWAVSEDGRTVYFRLDEEARYSDGVPVKAADFMFGSYIRLSDDIVNPYAKQYYRENLAGLVVYDERTLSISLPEAQIYAPATVGGLTPSPPHFYKDYGPDFTERYQWKFPPTTGAYKVNDEDVVKGVSVTQTRVKDWWAKDRKYYKYRFNADRIRHTVVRDESKAFELFRAGELDTFYVTRPEYWYEKSEMEPVFDGYIERYTFYNQWPALPRGLYMNVTKPLLEERDVRIGIQHSMNWQKVIDVIFRGDYERLNSFNQGYLLFSDSAIKARAYSIPQAREAFRRAGFTEPDRNGILKRKDGTRLSVSVSYPAIPILDKMFAILREEARACGFDLRLDSNEATVDYKKVMQKQHEMSFGAWVISPPTPDFYQFMHSTNARDERGNLKPQTNNLWVWGRADTDVLAEKVRNARTEEELREAAVKLQNIIHEEAIFVPAYTTDFVRVASWRWVRWPDSGETKFSPPVVYEPLEAYAYWIDEEMKEETMAARRGGKTFEEVNRIVDAYRYGVDSGVVEPGEGASAAGAEEEEEPARAAEDPAKAAEEIKSGEESGEEAE